MKMRESYILLLIFINATVFPPAAHAACRRRLPSDSLVVITFNIRFDNPSDGPHAWANRRHEVNKFLNEARPAILGLQEALYHQILDIHQSLPHMKWYGVGRDDGRQGGEFSPVFYDTSQYSLKDAGTVWLSETPGEPGRLGWDAACPRVLTWAIFEPRKAGKMLFVMNTHFDHMGETARLKSAEMVSAIARSRFEEGYRILFMGDLNAESASAVCQVLAGDRILTEAASLAVNPELGDGCTFTGFDLSACQRLDYIWLSGNPVVRVYKILPNQRGGVTLSDHKAVLAIIEERQDE